jgi:hypothetical protein
MYVYVSLLSSSGIFSLNFIYIYIYIQIYAVQIVHYSYTDCSNMSSEGAVIVIAAGLCGEFSGKCILEAFVFEVSYWMRYIIIDQH